MEAQEKLMKVLRVLWKLVGAFTCLYFFVCSLNFLADSLRLLGGENAGKVFFAHLLSLFFLALFWPFVLFRCSLSLKYCEIQ